MMSFRPGTMSYWFLFVFLITPRKPSTIQLHPEAFKKYFWVNKWMMNNHYLKTKWFLPFASKNLGNCFSLAFRPTNVSLFQMQKTSGTSSFWSNIERVWMSLLSSSRQEKRGTNGKSSLFSDPSENKVIEQTAALKTGETTRHILKWEQKSADGANT